MNEAQLPTNEQISQTWKAYLKTEDDGDFESAEIAVQALLDAGHLTADRMVEIEQLLEFDEAREFLTFVHGAATETIVDVDFDGEKEASVQLFGLVVSGGLDDIDNALKSEEFMGSLALGISESSDASKMAIFLSDASLHPAHALSMDPSFLSKLLGQGARIASDLELGDTVQEGISEAIRQGFHQIDEVEDAHEMMGWRIILGIRIVYGTEEDDFDVVDDVDGWYDEMQALSDRHLVSIEAPVLWPELSLSVCMTQINDQAFQLIAMDSPAGKPAKVTDVALHMSATNEEMHFSVTKTSEHENYVYGGFTLPSYFAGYAVSELLTILEEVYSEFEIYQSPSQLPKMRMLQ